MGASDSHDDADTRYTPPPDAYANGYDPQLEWLRRQLVTAQAEQPPAPARQPRREQLLDERDDDWDDEDAGDDDADEEDEPAVARRRVATDTGLIPRAWIIFVMVWVVRSMMLAMLVASFIGSIASFNPQGIGPILAAFPWLHTTSPWFVSGAQRSSEVIGLLLQVWITGVEYWKAPPKLSLLDLFRKRHWFYSAHLGLDIGLTLYGWHPVVIPWLVQMIGRSLAGFAVTNAPAWAVLLAAYALLLVVAFAFALLPERTLVR